VNAPEREGGGGGGARTALLELPDAVREKKGRIEGKGFRAFSSLVSEGGGKRRKKRACSPVCTRSKTEKGDLHCRGNKREGEARLPTAIERIEKAC